MNKIEMSGENIPPIGGGVDSGGEKDLSPEERFEAILHKIREGGRPVDSADLEKLLDAGDALLAWVLERTDNRKGIKNDIHEVVSHNRRSGGIERN